MREWLNEVSTGLGVGVDQLTELLHKLDAVYDSASDSPSEIAKTKLYELSNTLNHPTSHMCRVVAKLEAESRESELQPLVEEVQGALINWRQEYQPA